MQIWMILFTLVLVLCIDKCWPFQACIVNQVTVRLASNGHCINAETCNYLKNCSILHGSLIIRQSVQEKEYNTTLPDFRKLREITGFLVITFFKDVFHHLPSLSVIRGEQLVGNYALIVYFNTQCKILYFPKLTTILHGGVRINRNKILCYVNTVRWKSIVKDKDQEGKYGIVIKSNNLDCDSACYSKKCYAATGHGNDPKAQFCWGPGNEKDHQCQRFCDTRCGLQGCVDGSTSECCHEECLGGCSKSKTPMRCDACKHYRIWKTGQCVDHCPKNTYLIDNLFCKAQCPGWNDPTAERHLVLDGKCVKSCPAGYLPENDTCINCMNQNDCPRICELDWIRTDNGMQSHRGAIIKVPGDIASLGLTGCTEINGSLTFEIPEGTGNILEFVQTLKMVRVVRGSIDIKKSALKNLDFFESLVEISPPSDKYLIHGRYAVQIFKNELLESLWTPKNDIKVTRGQIFARYNSRLCPRELYNLQRRMHTPNGGNVTGDISEETNGNRVPCEVERLEISVTEIKIPPSIFEDVNLWMMYTLVNADQLDCINRKCLEVSWNFTRQHTSYNIIFYQIYYRKLGKSETTSEVIVSDDTDNLKWKTVDVPRPDSFEKVKRIKHILKELDPYAYYAIFIQEEVSKGEKRTSKIHYIQISPGLPSAPLGLEASFLSSQSIHLKWRKPDYPNGVITKYVVYWQRSAYSFWEDQAQLEWCKRDIKSGVNQQSDLKKKTAPQGECLTNRTCICDAEKEQSIAVKADRDAHSFRTEFLERINKVLFTKEKNGNKNIDKKIDIPIMPIGTTPHTTLSSMLTTTPAATRKNNNARSNITVLGDVYTYVVTGLEYFQGYEFTVCACTATKEGGCARPKSESTDPGQPCATAQARTDVNVSADVLSGPLLINVNDQLFNVSWAPPIKPNAVILKYDVVINYETGNNDITYCRASNDTFLTGNLQPGNYYAKVRAISPAGNGSWSNTVSFTIEQYAAETDTTLVLGVSVGAAVLILILIAFVVYYAFFKRSMEKDSPGVLYASVNPEYMNSNEVYMPDEWELNRETIELLRELGQGSFGMVFEGIAHDINGEPELRVAVKTVNESASIRDRIEFLQEASIMKAFNSNHVVRLIGVVSQGQPTFVVMELMARGDLKTFLRSRRPEEKNPKLLPPMRAEMLQIAAEIADGMAYLAARKYVHRDLAARNCMVAVDFTVKIGDFGMARDIYETDYYRKGGKGLLPVRWMAPESLRDGIFTTASDVWSFGVVMWEITMLAAQPYQGKSNEEVLKFILNGGQLEYASDCVKQMQQFMELCWARDPKLRPSFLEIIRLLEDDVSEDFIACSFYHEMKKKALEDTLCQEGNLYELLSRPALRPHAPNMKMKRRDSLSDDSGAFIDNCKPETDQSPSINSHKLYQPSSQDPSIGGQGESGMSTPTSTHSSQPAKKHSIYDNLDEQMKYGDSPVAPGNNRSSRNGSASAGNGDNLDLNKIFGGGKAVPV